MTYDGSGKAAGLRLFVDGKQADVEVVRDTLTGSIKTDAPLRLGSKALGKPFIGQIDDLRLYNRALTPEQIEQLALHYAVRVVLSGVTGKRSRDEAGAREGVLPHLRCARRVEDDEPRAEGAAQAEGGSRQGHPDRRW